MSFFLKYPALKNAVRMKTDHGTFFITEHGKDLIDPRDVPKINAFFEHGVILKNSATTTAALAAFSPDGDPMFLKRCNNKGFRFTMRYLFRCARVFRAAYAAEMLEKAGVPTPKVLLAGEKRRGLLLKAGFLVTSSSSDIRAVAQLIRETGVPELCLEAFLAQAAEMTVRLHRNSIEHGDLKIVNFYHQGPDMDFGIWDLDSVRFHKNGVPLSRVERELSRIIFSLHLSAKSNPAFPEELYSCRNLTDRLAALYRKEAEAYSLPLPDPEKVFLLAEQKLEYLKRHPYRQTGGADHA